MSSPKKKKSRTDRNKVTGKSNSLSSKQKPSTSAGLPKLALPKGEKASHFLILLAAFTAFLYFGLNHLSSFFTTDEIVWLYERFPGFWNNLKSGNYSGTDFELGYSGVLQNWLSGWYEPFSPENFSTSTFQT